MNASEKSITTQQRAFLLLLLVLFGAANTIILKLENIQQISPGVKFFHPYIQGCCMFLGQSICIFAYIFKRCRSNKNQNRSSLVLESKPPIPRYLILIPAFLDFIASNLAYIGLTLISSSVWQISKGGVIIMTAIFTRIFLKKILTTTKILGCLFALAGITLVEIVTVLYSSGDQADHSTGQTIFGLLIVIVSLVFTGLQFVYEEYLFKCYELDVFELVGFEGLIGLTMNIILVTILSYIHCPWSKCGGGEFIESARMYFDQLNANKLLMALAICQIFSMAISVSLAVTVTKKIGATSRALVDITRTVIIWGVGLILHATMENPIYHYESLNLKENLFQLAGFIIVIIGTLIYHDLVPCIGKSKREEEEEETKLLNSLIGSTDYRQSSNRVSIEALT